MAEKGLFRSSLRGFNRQDVLQYIDTLQSEQEQALFGVKQRIAQLEEELEAAQKERDEAVNKAVALSEQNDHLEELINEHNQANRELRAQIEAGAQKRDEEVRLTEELRRIASENRTLRAKQAQYQMIVERLTEITEQMRKHSVDFLGSTYDRSGTCLDGLEEMVNAYEQELADTRRRIAEARQTLEEQRIAAGLHLDELLKEILGESDRPLTDFLDEAKKLNTPTEKPRLANARPVAKRPENRGGAASWLANLLGGK